MKPRAIADVVKAAVPAPKPVARPVFLFCGIPVVVQFSRRPRVQRLTASKPKGSSVGDAGI